LSATSAAARYLQKLGIISEYYVKDFNSQKHHTVSVKAFSKYYYNKYFNITPFIVYIGWLPYQV